MLMNFVIMYTCTLYSDANAAYNRVNIIVVPNSTLSGEY